MKCQSKVVLNSYYFKGGVSREKLKGKVELANSIIILCLISIKSTAVV